MDINHFKEKLEGELAQVTKELESIAVFNEETGDWEAKEVEMDEATPVADPNEAADAQEEFVNNQSINEALETRYKEIKHALEKIERGTYGTCEVSGEQIEEDRLEANPAARTCKAHM